MGQHIFDQPLVTELYISAVKRIMMALKNGLSAAIAYNIDIKDWMQVAFSSFLLSHNVNSIV